MHDAVPQNKNATPSLKNVFKTLRINPAGHLTSPVLAQWLKLGVKRAGTTLKNKAVLREDWVETEPGLS